MSILQQPVCAVLVGSTRSDAEAREIVQRWEQCPYVSDYEAAGSDVRGVYVLPEEKRWWVMTLQLAPEVYGMQEAKISFLQDELCSSPWSRGEVKAVADKTPCGAECENCLHFGRRCGGCPVTSFSRAP